MGSWDGAEICEIVGLYLLSQLSSELQINLGLYRDDGLCASPLTPRQNDMLQKEICKIFQRNNLSITIQTN